MSSEKSQSVAQPAPLSVTDPIGGLSLRLRLLRRYLTRIACGAITVVTPEGERIAARGAHPGAEATIVLRRWRTLRRLLFSGDIGFAESYVDGDWDSPDLTALIVFAAENQRHIAEMFAASRPRWALNRLRHALRGNSRSGSRRNITAHYDLGNDFYALWLDSGMTYSSALYLAGENALEAAQTAKQDRVLELLGLDGDESVLEIGCGWGGLAQRIAERANHVTALTLSPSQRAHAAAAAREAGLDSRIDVALMDYREAGGQFDRIVSIEMLEAVGEAYWPSYFATLKARLKPGGSAVLQVITIEDSRFEDYRRETDFIQRHIFPGGMLPSPSILSREIEKAGLVCDFTQTFGPDYARTLAEWRNRFEKNWPDIRAIGFPATFRRLWTYYLSYCEAGFQAGALDVGLYRLRHAEEATA
jgi:cyclopropane-fatty-acyl-phospholipid synthase